MHLSNGVFITLVIFFKYRCSCEIKVFERKNITFDVVFLKCVFARNAFHSMTNTVNSTTKILFEICHSSVKLTREYVQN